MSPGRLAPTPTDLALGELRAGVTSDLTRSRQEIDKLFRVTSAFEIELAAMSERLKSLRAENTPKVEKLQLEIEQLRERVANLRPEDFVTRLDMATHMRETDGIIRDVHDIDASCKDLEDRVNELEHEEVDTKIQSAIAPLKKTIEEQSSALQEIKEQLSAWKAKFALIASIASLIFSVVAKFVIDILMHAFSTK